MNFTALKAFTSDSASFHVSFLGCLFREVLLNFSISFRRALDILTKSCSKNEDIFVLSV